MTDGTLFDEFEASWPPETVLERDGWRLRSAPGAGSRVNSARRSPSGGGGDDPISDLERISAELGRAPLMQAPDSDQALIRTAAARGYRAFDETVLHQGTIDAARDLTRSPPSVDMRIYDVESAPAALDDLWRGLGVGPERRAVMGRAAAPKWVLTARVGDRLAGAVFACAPAGRSFIHALAVAPAARRAGVARALVGAALDRAAAAGATSHVAAIVRGNAPSERLFASLGAAPIGSYVYLVKSASAPDAPRP